MTTYFIRTTLPLDEAHRAVFAAHHAESTSGNQLSIMANGARTECLIKCNCSHGIDEILPDGFAATEVITDIDAARALLSSVEWIGALAP